MTGILTYRLNFTHARSTPGVAGHLPVVGSHERSFLDKPQGGQNIGYVVEAANFSCVKEYNMQLRSLVGKGSEYNTPSKKLNKVCSLLKYTARLLSYTDIHPSIQGYMYVMYIYISKVYVTLFLSVCVTILLLTLGVGRLQRGKGIGRVFRSLWHEDTPRTLQRHLLILKDKCKSVHIMVVPVCVCVWHVL